MRGFLGKSKWRIALSNLFFHLTDNFLGTCKVIYECFYSYRTVISPSIKHILFRQVKRCQLESSTSQSWPSTSSGVPLDSVRKSPKKFLFNISGTSKFSGDREVLGKYGKEVLLRKTLAHGTHHGIGVFCLTEAGESQIGWVPVPEKDEANLNAIENALHLPNFRAKINRASAKKLGDKFTKITISILCEIDE